MSMLERVMRAWAVCDHTKPRGHGWRSAERVEERVRTPAVAAVSLRTEANDGPAAGSNRSSIRPVLFLCSAAKAVAGGSSRLP